MNKNKPPLITIGITCFNAEQTITRAIKSATNQTWKNYEILIVDDGSSDSSLEKINQFKKQCNRIRVIKHEKNRGTALARNTLLNNARGELIAFFDDDDESLPERIELQFEAIQKYEKIQNAKLIFCYCDRMIIKNNYTADNAEIIGLGIGRMLPAPKGVDVADALLWKPRKLQANTELGLMGSGTMMIKMSIFETLEKFDPLFKRSAEIDLAIRAAFKGAHFISVPSPLIKQYKTDGLEKSDNRPLYYNLLLRKKNKTYLQKKGVYLSSILRAYSNFYFNKKNNIKAMIYLVSANLAAPKKVLMPNLIKKIRNF